MEFLFENPIFIIMIIGYLLSLVKKKKAEDPQQRKKSPPIYKPFTAEPMAEKELKQDRLEKPMIESRQRNDETQMRLEKEMLVRKEQAEVTLAELKKQQQSVEKQVSRIRAVNETPSEELMPIAETNKKSASSAGKNQIVEGIIWSEIIGRPRSLNPHKSLKQRK